MGGEKPSVFWDSFHGGVCIQYIGREHKINSGYKKSLFTDVSSQECGFLFYMTEISKACFISPLAFHPPKQIDTVQGFFFLNSCLLEFWWWNVAVCSIPRALNFSAPPFSVPSFTIFLPQVWLISSWFKISPLWLFSSGNLCIESLERKKVESGHI